MTIDPQDVAPSYSPLSDEVGMQPIAYWLAKAFEEIDAEYFREFSSRGVPEKVVSAPS